MRRFSILCLGLAITLVFSACGAQPTPTAAPVDVQSTMAVAAMTIIAQTQAAIPTATPVPPTATFTDTPAATNTLPPLPTLDATFTAAPSGNNGGGDPCIQQTLPASLQGKTVRIRISNSTKVRVSVTVYLNQTSPQNLCGYRSYSLESQESIVINDMVEGCYTLWAWNPVPEDYFIVTNGTNCLDSSLANWAFDISTRDIRLR